MDFSTLESLPEDVLINIFIDTDLDRLMEVCQLSKRLNTIICDNENYWRQRFIKDFNYPMEIPKSWKEEYLYFEAYWDSQVWIFPGDIMTDDQIAPRQGGLPGSPFQYKDLHHIVKAEVGNGVYMFVDLYGNVYMLGWNRDPSIQQSYFVEPKKISGLPPIVDISLRFKHAMAIDVNGKVWRIGYPPFLNSSDGKHSSFIEMIEGVPEMIEGVPEIVEVSAWYSKNLLLDKFGQVWITDDYLQPVKIPGLPRITEISAGSGYLLLDQDGKVWFGYKNKEFRIIEGIPKISRIYINNHKAVLLDEQGDLFYQSLNNIMMGVPFESVEGLPPITDLSVNPSQEIVLIDINGYIWREVRSEESYESSFMRVNELDEIVSVSRGLGSLVALRRSSPIMPFQTLHNLLRQNKITTDFKPLDGVILPHPQIFEFATTDGDRFLVEAKYEVLGTTPTFSPPTLED